MILDSYKGVKFTTEVWPRITRVELHSHFTVDNLNFFVTSPFNNLCSPELQCREHRAWVISEINRVTKSSEEKIPYDYENDGC